MREEAEVQELLRRVCGAAEVRRLGRLQQLWSGWGEIARYEVTGGSGSGTGSVIVKRVQPPARARHPRGWDSATSEGRKRRSYEVEEHFYRTFAPRLPERVRVARALYLEPGLFVFEDLDAAGFPGRAVGAGSLARLRIHGCVTWLAGLHAAFLGTEPVGEGSEGLWPEGCYWHLETRPEELAVMPDGPLKEAAPALDRRLREARFRTLVHGDAKVANFCFGRIPEQVAALDFQYVGGGVGVRDLAYFLGSVLGDRELEAQADDWLDHYLALLRRFLPAEADAEGLEAEWRALWPVAWADFERFLAGWAPGHWKRSGYAARMTAEALASLDREGAGGLSAFARR